MSTSLSTLPSSSLVAPSHRLWTSGRFALRVHGAPEYDRPVEIRRPFALIGRAPGADVVLDDHAVNPRHVYLHLDRRGLFAVDLATRTGSRIGPLEQETAWLRPGESIEVAGYHVELAALHLDDPDLAGPGMADPLADIADGPCVSLYPDGGALPLILRSQLIFAGRSEACGVHIDDAQLAPVQCVLVRSEQGVYVVDFLGRATRLNNLPLRTHALLSDGDALAIGVARFECRVVASADSTNGGPTSSLIPDPWPLAHSSLATRSAFGGPVATSELAWMLGALQATHGELLRRQDAFQRDVMRSLRKLHKQQSLGHSLQLVRLGHLNQEVSALRDEVRRRYGPTAPARRAESPRALPSVPPLPPTGTAIDDTDAWLSRRIHQINQENQAARREALRK